MLRVFYTDVVFSPDGRHIATVKDSTDIWDAETGEELFNVPGTKPVFISDGKIFTTIWGYLTAWDAFTGEKLFTTEGQETRFSPDGSLLLAIATPRKKLYVSLTEFEAHLRPKRMRDFSRISPIDPSLFHGKTEVWELSSRRKLSTLIGHSPVYHPNGRHLATVQGDGRVMIWDASTGKLLTSLGCIRVLVQPYQEQMVMAMESIDPQFKGPYHRPDRFSSKEVVIQEQVVQKVDRFVQVQYSQQVCAEQSFSISVGLVRQAPSNISDAKAIDVYATIDAEGRSTGAKPITVTFHAAAFVVESPRAELQVYADKDTEPTIFRLISLPGVNGLHPVSIRFFQGWECLGEVVAVIQVVPDSERQADEVKKYLTIRTLPHERWGAVIPPDVVLYVTRQNYQGRDTLFYEYEWVQKGWPRMEAGKIVLQGSVEDWVETHYAALSKFARSDTFNQSRGIESDRRELEKIGENLYYELFTGELHDFYMHFAPTARSLLIYSNEPWIPWEVVKPWGKGLAEELSDFLCARFQLARWYTNEDGRRVYPTMALSQLSAIVSPALLPAVSEEIAYLNMLPKTWPPLAIWKPLPRQAREVLNLMATGKVQLFHFATHGRLQPPQKSVATVVVGKDSLRVSDLIGKNIVEGLTRSAPLIFMNACHSGRQDHGLRRLEGWADRFITFGCSGFVGANWEVQDKLASNFAINFYEALRSGKAIAQAMQESRLAIRKADPSNSTWLAYSLYAHPNLTIRTAG